MSSWRIFFVRYLQGSGISSLQIYMRSCEYFPCKTWILSVLVFLHQCILQTKIMKSYLSKNIYDIKFKVILNSGFLHFSLLKGLSLEFQVIILLQKRSACPILNDRSSAGIVVFLAWKVFNFENFLLWTWSYPENTEKEIIIFHKKRHGFLKHFFHTKF